MKIDNDGPLAGPLAARYALPIVRRAKTPLPEWPGLSGRGTEFDPRFAPFLPASREIVARPPSRVLIVSGYVLCGLVLAALLGAMIWRLSLFAIAPGQVEVRGGVQVVEPRQLGQIAAIRAKDGDHVRRDDIVLELDATTARANQAALRDKLGDLRAEILRRRTAIDAARETPIRQDAGVAWSAGFSAAVRAREDEVLRADLSQLAATLADLKAQRQAKQAARDKFAAGIVAQKSLVEARTERTGMHEQLATQGWDSRVRVLEALEPLRQEQVALAGLEGSRAEAEAAIPLIDSEIAKTRENFTTTNVQQIATAERQVADLAQQLAKADSDLADMSLRAPVDGTVHASAVTTLGQTVKPGEQVLQVVPDGAPLEIQAYVLNTDIGFVRQGQKATIKVDAFPYTRYGTIEGTVALVAADAVAGGLALQQEESGATPDSHGPLSVTAPAEQTRDLVFPVTIVPSKNTITVDGREVPLSPGMSVAVEIETRRQRVMQYIMFPLTRAFAGKGT